MISNASPLINFGKVNRLDLLFKVFGKIIISPAVYEEVIENGLKKNAPEAMILKDFIEKKAIIVKKLSAEGKNKADFLEKVHITLDYGEAETIVLALEQNEKEVLIDERVARKAAKLEGLEPRGSLMVLLKAYHKKLLDEKEIRMLITEMTSTKFRLSAEVINKFWLLFEEMKK